MVSQQLRLLHGRVGDSTTSANSLRFQMGELVEDAVASWCGDIVGHFWLIRNELQKLVKLICEFFSLCAKVYDTICIMLSWAKVYETICIMLSWAKVYETICIMLSWAKVYETICIMLSWAKDYETICIMLSWAKDYETICIVLITVLVSYKGVIVFLHSS